MSFQTAQYIPSSRRDAIRALPVDYVHAVGHSRKPWGNRFTNHWCLYLQTGENSSVRIDMVPSYYVASTVIQGGSKGNLIISKLEYEYSSNATKVVTIQPPQGLCVSDVIDTLLAAGRDKYEFNGEGVGCRMWTADALNLLEKKGWGSSTNYEAAKQAIAKLWPDGTDLPLDHGAYY
ncbi:hypothetical protein BDY21DRAFT_360142 [Lineolata rhizophorae]|uniref:DUF7770 domain-containing protein n=1 Tax=Lineolata rhizophorae TaxID=578093 RepID=A0A6A6PEA7_9PEZI|nr:hypothetical protein BDY21DRAFT_360142 [Lineolata rhizophorae]